MFATVGGCDSPNAPPPDSAFALVRVPGLDTTGAFFNVDFVSSNGSTVIGTLYHPGSGGPRTDLFRWTPANGLAVLEFPAGLPSAGKLFASSLSKVARDGDVLAGFALVTAEGAGAASIAFRWATSGATTLPAPLDQTPFSVVDMSSDGQTIVGTAGGHAFRWTSRDSDGVQSLGALPGDRQSVAIATSADGGTVVGLSSSANAEPFAVAGWKPFKWTEASGIVPLEVPTGMSSCNSRPGLTSADGGTTVGKCSSSSSLPGGVFRWRGGAVEALALPAEGSGDPRFMTEDGSVVVGSVQPMRPGGLSALFRWSETAGIELLPSSFKMLAMNRDATVIVGQAGSLPARWEEATGHTGTWPIPSGFEDGRPLSVTDDGTLSAGEVSASAGGPDETRRTEAAIWEDADGVRLVRDVLLARGVDLRGATLVTARISADGSTLSGTATMQTRNDALWVARLSP